MHKCNRERWFSRLINVGAAFWKFVMNVNLYSLSNLLEMSWNRRSKPAYACLLPKKLKLYDNRHTLRRLQRGAARYSYLLSWKRLFILLTCFIVVVAPSWSHVRAENFINAIDNQKIQNRLRTGDSAAGNTSRSAKLPRLFSEERERRYSHHVSCIYKFIHCTSKWEFSIA